MAYFNFPTEIILVPKNSHLIFVEKRSQRLFLLKETNKKLNLVQEFQCSTGKNFGRKEIEGDKKTPEGIYFFIRQYEKYELLPLYGTNAFSLNYPNFLDKKAKRGGFAIWLHGTNKEFKNFDSNGCVVLENKNIDFIAEFIKLYFTPIIIVEKIKRKSLDNLSLEKDNLKKILKKWQLNFKRKFQNQNLKFNFDEISFLKTNTYFQIIFNIKINNEFLGRRILFINKNKVIKEEYLLRM